MPKDFVPMSVSVKPETAALLDISAAKLGIRRSVLVRKLISKYLDVEVNDDNKIPVILRIPSELKDDHEGLKKWLDSKVDYLLNKFDNEG